MRKLWIVLLIALLSGCSYQDEYGVDDRKYENVIHCELTNYEEGYSSTIIEQLYGNNGIVEYLYSEQLMIFEDTSVVNNTKEEKQNDIKGFSITVSVDKKHGAVSTVTRIDYTKVDYAELLYSLTGELNTEEDAEYQKQLATDMSMVDMTYCSVLK